MATKRQDGPRWRADLFALVDYLSLAVEAGDPALVKQQAAWRRKGGQSRSNAARARRQLPAEPMTVDELRGLLGVVMRRVIDRELEPAIGSSVAALARTYLAATEASDVQERLARLEADAGIDGGRRGVG